MAGTGKKKGKAKRKPPKREPLEGFEIGVNSFGEIQSNIDIDRINEFLNRNTEDKKLKGRKKKK